MHVNWYTVAWINIDSDFHRHVKRYTVIICQVPSCTPYDIITQDTWQRFGAGRLIWKGKNILTLKSMYQILHCVTKYPTVVIKCMQYVVLHGFICTYVYWILWQKGRKWLTKINIESNWWFFMHSKHNTCSLRRRSLSMFSRTWRSCRLVFYWMGHGEDNVTLRCRCLLCKTLTDACAYCAEHPENRLQSAQAS